MGLTYSTAAAMFLGAAITASVMVVVFGASRLWALWCEAQDAARQQQTGGDE